MNLSPLLHLFLDPTTDKKAQVPYSRHPSAFNTLDEDVTTKQEKKNASAVITKRMNAASDELLCPTEREAKFELFAVICSNNHDCEKIGRNSRCCKLFGSKRCHEGFEKQLEDVEHERELILIGYVKSLLT